MDLGTFIIILVIIFFVIPLLVGMILVLSSAVKTKGVRLAAPTDVRVTTRGLTVTATWAANPAPITSYTWSVLDTSLAAITLVPRATFTVPRAGTYTFQVVANYFTGTGQISSGPTTTTFTTTAL